MGSAAPISLRLFDDPSALGHGEPLAIGVASRAGAATNEYWTRKADLAPARAVLGSIDLDPASCPAANDRVRAQRIFTVEDDGLRVPWVARTVWLNPPYSRLSEWVRKLVRHYEHGDVGAAIAFVSVACVGDRWFHECGAVRYPLCLRNGRARFDGPDGRGRSGRAGHVWLYLGPEPWRFERVFSPLGAVVSVGAHTNSPTMLAASAKGFTDTEPGR